MAEMQSANSKESKGRWNHLLKLLQRPGPLTHPAFEPGTENLDTLHSVRVLVVGAGGLGCELLKDLAFCGFREIDVIDMDTIDLSNLNRQFLFRNKDIGRSKAEVAAEFINRRVAGCNVTAHCCKIQDKDENFYRSFRIVMCGLDSVDARRWLNAMVVGLLEYNDDGSPNTATVTPMIDGGTEGFNGNARVILPGFTPCVECTIGLYPPQVNFPLCTIAHTPRLPEHCVEYVRIIQWEKEKPFDGETTIDGDNPDHIDWIWRRAEQRAAEYHIVGVSRRLTQGVVKHIIPAVASTNAVIAAACALEAFKMACQCALLMNNYLNFSDADGVFAGVIEMERRSDCAVCAAVPAKLRFSADEKLERIVQHLTDSPDFQMKSPSITAAGKTLYFPNIPSLEKQSKLNLKKTLKQLELCDGDELGVADVTTPRALTFRLELTATSPGGTTGTPSMDES